MRVLHVNDHLALKGGVEVYALSLSQALTERGHDVGFAFGAGDASAWKPSFSVPEISSIAWGRKAAGAVAMERVLKEYSPDLCHVHSVYNPGVIQACLDHGPTVLHLHDYRYSCPSSGLYYHRSEQICERACSPACFPIGWGRGCQTWRLPAGWAFYDRVQFIKRHAARFHAVLANSHYVARRFEHSIGQEAALQVLHYFCPLRPAKVAPPRGAGNSILFLGRVREIKGIVPFLEVLSRLPESVTGKIVGDPDVEMRRLIQERADAFGCDSRLSVTGWASREQVAEWMREATAVIFPSLWAEPFGIVGVEAMSQGVPVVGFDVGGVSDWLEDGGTGFLVPRGDTIEMADKVSSLLSDRALRERMGAAGIARVEEKFGLEAHLARLIEVYEGAMGERSG